MSPELSVANCQNCNNSVGKWTQRMPVIFTVRRDLKYYMNNLQNLPRRINKIYYHKTAISYLIWLQILKCDNCKNYTHVTLKCALKGWEIIQVLVFDIWAIKLQELYFLIAKHASERIKFLMVFDCKACMFYLFTNLTTVNHCMQWLTVKNAVKLQSEM